MIAPLAARPAVSASLPERGHDRPRIHGPSVYGARPGHPFLYRIPATGKRPMEFSAGGLPRGLVLDRVTGIITGAATEAGTTTVRLRVRNSRGTDERQLRIVIGSQLALTPPMGWSSWESLQSEVSDRDIRAQADALIESGLADHGYSYVDIDDGWSVKRAGATGRDASRDPQGNIRANGRFHDMKALTDYLHKHGLKAGIYSSPGPTTCGVSEGSFEHELQDAKQFAAWGFDLLKYDMCSYHRKDNSVGELQKPYRLMGSILAGLDRDILFNLCQYGEGKVWEWGREVGGQFWRMTGDVGWGDKGIYTLWDNIARNFDPPGGLARQAGPGGWNDLDNLMIGYVAYVRSDARPPNVKTDRVMPAPLTPDEVYTHMSFWSLMASPLILGCDLTKLDPFTFSVLANNEVIDVDQDPLGRTAARVFNDGALSVWAKNLEDGSIAVGLFNLGDREADVPARWEDLGITGPRRARDLWLHEDLGLFDRQIQGHVAPHGVVLLRLSAGDRH